MSRDLFDKYNDGRKDGRDDIRAFVASLIAERVSELDSKLPPSIMNDEDAVLTDSIYDEKSFLKSLNDNIANYY